MAAPRSSGEDEPSSVLLEGVATIARFQARATRLAIAGEFDEALFLLAEAARVITPGARGARLTFTEDIPPVSSSSWDAISESGDECEHIHSPVDGGLGGAIHLKLSGATPRPELLDLLVPVIALVLELRRDKQRAAALVDELDHRVRNMLTTVQGLAYQWANTARTERRTENSLYGQLAALGIAHGLLTEDECRRAELSDLLETLAGYAGFDGRVRWHGPKVQLSVDMVTSLALAFQELVANAARHGSLSCPQGYVDVHGDLSGQWLRLLWKEHGGPPVVAPFHRGFGMRLLEKTARGGAQLRFEEDGLACRIDARVEECMTE